MSDLDNTSDELPAATASGLDRVEFETRMADDAIWAAAQMRKANAMCAKREVELDNDSASARTDDAWRKWHSRRATGASTLLRVKRVMKAEGYPLGDKAMGDYLSEVYRNCLRYERVIHLNDRAASCAAEIASGLKSLSGASVGRDPTEIARPLMQSLYGALARRNEGIDTRRLLHNYIDDADLQGLNLAEAFALAGAVWNQYIGKTTAA